ncbi:MFS transporter [Gorillibacterium timonense]|uniref:MFS transporter n=1 Tax=Gorillibacterium timonense TaxID=1689269 RepID=UPI00071C96AA|nr:MFS transporter [Gorillibacterium timonense]
MRDLFRNRLFVRLFAASFASQLSTIIGTMAFAFYLLDHFASQPRYASLAELMYSLPTLLVFFLVGVLADRFDRQRIAANSNWIRLGLTAVLIGAILVGVLPLIFVILFLRSAVAKFYAPAETALLQGILEEKQYVTASGLNQMLFGVFMLFGVGLGAVAYTTIGIYGAVGIDAAGFLIAGLLLETCAFPAAVKQPGGPAVWRELGIKSVLLDFRAGLAYVLRNKLLLSLIGGFFLFGFMNGGFAVLPMFTMKYKLAGDAYKTFSSLFAVFLGIGLLIGSALAPMVVKRFKPHWTMIVALFFTGGFIIVLSFIDNPWLYLSLVLLLGLIIAPINVAIGGWIPSIVEPTMMGRVTAWNDPVLMLGQSITLGLISLLYPGTVSLQFIYLLLAGFILAAFVWFALTLPRLSRQAEAAAAE